MNLSFRPIPFGCAQRASRANHALGMTMGSVEKESQPRPRDFLAAAESRVPAAGFFLPSISARLCLRAAMRSTTGANFLGFSTSTTLPPSSFVSMMAPVLSGQVDWHRAADLHLITPFPGWFGGPCSPVSHHGACSEVVGWTPPAVWIRRCG